MGEWRDVRIRDLGRVVTGATPRAGDGDSWGDEVDFLTPSDQRFGVRYAAVARRLSLAGAGRLASRVVPAGTTCVTCIGATIGKTSLAARPTVTNQQINSVVPDEGAVLSGFLYYLLTALGPRLARAASGSAAPIVNKRQFGNLAVRVPDLGTQDQIGSVLGALDDKIAANERTARTALALAGARFEGLLRTASAGSAPAGLPGPGSGAAGWWRVGDLADLRYGRSLPAASRNPGDVPVYGSAGVVGSHDRALVDGPGIVVGRKGTAGAVHWSQRDFFPIDTTFYVVPRTAEVPLEFLFFALARLGLELMGSDSAVPGLSRVSALTSRVLVPGPAAVVAFRREASELFALSESLRRQSAHLAKLRDSLLPGLISGEIRMRDAARAVTQALPNARAGSAPLAHRPPGRRA